MAEPTRPVWRDLIVGEYDGSNMLQFDTTKPTLPLLNEIKQEGTRHTSGRMNNLFVFDNLLSMSGAIYETVGWRTKHFTEALSDAVPDEAGEHRLLAKRVWEETEKGVWAVREELYDLNEFGQNVAVQIRTATMHKVGREWVGVVS